MATVEVFEPASTGVNFITIFPSYATYKRRKGNNEDYYGSDGNSLVGLQNIVISLQ
jgi:hypothetical protein